MRKFDTKLNFGMLKPNVLLPRLRDGLIGSWFWPGDEMSGNRMSLLCFALVNNVIANLVGGNYFTGLLLLLDADDAFIGLIGMIPFAANIVQLFAPMLLERFPKRKKLLMLFRFIALILNSLFVSVIPFLPVGHQLKLGLVAVTVGLVNCIHATLNPGFNMWHMQFLPNRVRANYFSTQSVAVSVLVAVVTMGASCLVDIFKKAGSEITGIMIVRGIAVLLVFVDAYCLWRMKEYDYESSGEKINLKDLFTKPFKEKNYLCSVAVALLWSFAANMPSSFYTVYLLQNVKVSYTYITALSLLNIPCMIIFTPLWRKVLNKYNSWFKTIQLALMGYLLHYVVLSLVTPSNYLWMYPLALVIAYPTGAGITLGFTNVPYLNIPKQNGTIFIAFYSTSCNVVAFLAVLLSRTIISRTEGTVLNIFGVPMINKQFYLLLVGFLMAVSAVLIWLIRRSLKKKGLDN